MPAAVIARLDYDKAEIRLAVRSPIEHQFRAQACAKEPWTVAFIEGMKRGDVLCDVGANVGSYSLLAAALGHEVVAIEPGLSNFGALLDNGRLNSTPGRIYALNVALGVTTERIPFPQNPAPGYGEGGTLSLEVQQITLDELIFGEPSLPKPTHLKIDVDGHELSVLAGARRSLVEGALRAVLVEVKRSLGERVADYLIGLGWEKIATHDKRNGEPIQGIVYQEFRRGRAEVVPAAVAGESPSITTEEG